MNLDKLFLFYDLLVQISIATAVKYHIKIPHTFWRQSTQKSCPGAPANESFPLGFLVDPTGLYLRHDGARFLSGLSPKSVRNFDVVFHSCCD